MREMPNYEREESINRKMSAMAQALRTIAGYGDCMHRDHPAEDEPPCGCPVCIAKNALAIEADWRFISNHENRQAHNPREAAIMAAWRRYMRGLGSGTPDFKLAQILGFESVTVRDWLVASTLIQWMTTNVGSALLTETGYHYDPPKPKP